MTSQPKLRVCEIDERPKNGQGGGMVKGSILVWLVLYSVFLKPHLKGTEYPEINRLRLEGGLQQPAQWAGPHDMRLSTWGMNNEWH